MNEKKNKIKLFKEKSKILKENKNLNDMGLKWRIKHRKDITAMLNVTGI